MRVSRLFLAAACVVFSVAHGQASADAFSEGKALGTSQVEGIFNKAKTGEGSEAIPKYGTAAPEQGYFLGGKGSLSPHGVTKLNTCASAAPGSDPMANQECEAVNFLAKNPQIRPQMPLSPNDPLFALHDQVSKDAESIFQQGMGGSGTSTQCAETTETTPAQYSVETCSDIKEIDQPQCVMGRKVNIDTDANYQCDETLKAYSQEKCNKTAVVTVKGNRVERRYLIAVSKGRVYWHTGGTIVLQVYQPPEVRIIPVPEGRVNYYGYSLDYPPCPENIYSIITNVYDQSAKYVFESMIPPPSYADEMTFYNPTFTYTTPVNFPIYYIRTNGGFQNQGMNHCSFEDDLQIGGYSSIETIVSWQNDCTSLEERAK